MEVFKSNGHKVLSTDLINRGYGDGAVDIAMRNGAYFPLKPVISVVNDSVREYTKKKAIYSSS